MKNILDFGQSPSPAQLLLRLILKRCVGGGIIKINKLADKAEVRCNSVAVMDVLEKFYVQILNIIKISIGINPVFINETISGEAMCVVEGCEKLLKVTIDDRGNSVEIEI